jgi:hypothetical protein
MPSHTPAFRPRNASMSAIELRLVEEASVAVDDGRPLNRRPPDPP